MGGKSQQSTPNQHAGEKKPGMVSGEHSKERPPPGLSRPAAGYSEEKVRTCDRNCLVESGPRVDPSAT
jgi:hypothetical protein